MCHSLILFICTIVPNHKDVQNQTNKCKIKEAKTKNTHSQSVQALHSLLLFICTMHNLILFKCTVHNHSKPHQTKSKLSIEPDVRHSLTLLICSAITYHTILYTAVITTGSKSNLPQIKRFTHSSPIT